MTSKQFADYTFDDAVKLFAAVTVDGVTVERRTATARTARQFYDADHWQDGHAFLGQLAPLRLANATQRNLEIKAGFISQNACKRIVERHLNGIFDREPLWGLVSGEIDDAGKPVRAQEESLTRWWDEREILQTYRTADKIALIEGRSALRLFFPTGRLGPDGAVPKQPNLEKALRFVFMQALTADQAGVFTDAETQEQIGVCLFADVDTDGKPGEKGAELSFINKGLTVLRVVRARSEPQDFGPYNLGGRLFVHELVRDALITEQVQSLQKAINLNHSMMLRNVNIAGARERSVANAQHPKAKKKIADAAAPGGVREIDEPGYYVTGGGAVNYLMGFPIYNDAGKVISYTNPTVSITDPSDPVSFLKTHEHYYTCLLDEADQLHFLMGSDAVASGVSREQARADFERSLKPTKHVTDAAGRWGIETPLRLAAQLAGQSDQFLPLRADFNTLINTGPLSAVERQENRADVVAGLLSAETAMSRNNIEDTGAEQERIKLERKE